MIPKMWERTIIKWRKSYIEGGSKLAGKKGQFSMGIFTHNGNEIEVPPNPKKETNIQPILQLLLQISLSGLGIHVVRETDVGVGILDFQCLYTTKENKAISISIEFKLAH